ncbi:MAG: hypothetical protein MHPSP_003590, partial [Paramarteilia canceri]
EYNFDPKIEDNTNVKLDEDLIAIPKQTFRIPKSKLPNFEALDQASREINGVVIAPLENFDLNDEDNEILNSSNSILVTKASLRRGKDLDEF